MTQGRLRAWPVPRRSEPEVLVDQVAGIDSWVRARAIAPESARPVRSREEQLDASRAREAEERAHQQLVRRAARQLEASDHLLRAALEPRAVLVHRHEWFRGEVAAGLESAGVHVLSCLQNGADAIGMVVAEQPDLVVLEDRLEMLSGVEVTRALREHAPHTAVAVHVSDEGEIGAFLEAGATIAFTRRIPPADVVADLVGLMGVTASPGTRVG